MRGTDILLVLLFFALCYYLQWLWQPTITKINASTTSPETEKLQAEIESLKKRAAGLEDKLSAEVEKNKKLNSQIFALQKTQNKNSSSSINTRKRSSLSGGSLSDAVIFGHDAVVIPSPKARISKKQKTTSNANTTSISTKVATVVPNEINNASPLSIETSASLQSNKGNNTIAGTPNSLLLTTISPTSTSSIRPSAAPSAFKTRQPTSVPTLNPKKLPISGKQAISETSNYSDAIEIVAAQKAKTDSVPAQAATTGIEASFGMKVVAKIAPKPTNMSYLTKKVLAASEGLLIKNGTFSLSLKKTENQTTPTKSIFNYTPRKKDDRKFYMYPLGKEFWWRWPNPGIDCLSEGRIIC